MINAGIIKRFWAKVDRTASCWLWTAAKTPDGYGKLGIRCYMEYAHRLSWEMHRGPIPAGMLVLHRCDTPSCVNPAHLFIGTQFDNMQDMVAKGRRRRAA